VHLRLLRSLAALAFASVFFLALGRSAYAGPQDKDAQKLLDSAMNDDYLATDFDKAEKKLKDAISKCGSGGCSPELVGKIQVALGTVYGVGLSKSSDAKAAFVAAFQADPKAALDPSLTTPELTKLFEEAKKSAASAPPPPPPSKPPPGGDSGYTPPKEAQVNTPLQLYMEPPDEVSKVVLKYMPFGATQWKSLDMAKMGKGYGAEIPCDDTGTTGDLKFYFAEVGTDGDVAGSVGTKKDPFRVPVKNELDATQPHFPGKKPPAQCKEKADCPPGLEGCPSGAKHGDKGWGSSCELSSECKEGLTCLNGSCEEDKGSGGGGGGGGGPKRRMNMVSLGVQIDALILSGKQGVCSAGSASYACFLQGTSHQYLEGLMNGTGGTFGMPTGQTGTNGVSGGFSYGDIRILVGYDRQIVKSLGLSLGIRLGFAIGGSPTPDNLPANAQGALPFLPVHAEGRVTYHILNNSMMEDKKFRPFVFLAGGLAQVNAGVPVTVCDTNTVGVAGNACSTGGASEPSPLNLKAYQITGRNFFGFGAGTTFGITPLFGLAFEIKMMFMVPTFGVVFAPTLSPVFNF
jgi:hypothetical protein